MIRNRFFASILLISSAVLAGCGTSGASMSPEMLAERERLLLTEEPLGVVPVLDARDALAGGDELVVLGQIGGVPNPWEAGRAAFMMADPSTFSVEDAGHVCTDEGCPFCKKAAQSNAHGLALVHFVDEHGELLPVDARQLLGVEENQMVVVRGRGAIDPMGHFILTASGVYIRR